MVPIICWGVWNGKDFATYYVREMPNGDVVWFAENNFWATRRRNDSRFARVFIGKKVDNTLNGTYVTIKRASRPQ